MWVGIGVVAWGRMVDRVNGGRRRLVVTVTVLDRGCRVASAPVVLEDVFDQPLRRLEFRPPRVGWRLGRRRRDVSYELSFEPCLVLEGD